ncbi:uncharacterized protein [Cherax quadricarinatus]|nr:uncharacterized protein LOC128700014 isoform X1 [Cherax quadricarinatus]
MAAVTLAIYEMSETKEEALCNNAQNHRQQLLNHQQELERDLEAGSCADEEDDEEENTDEGEEGEAGEGEEGEATEEKPKAVIPPLYNVEPGCTALSCYSAIATFIVMVLGIVALLMYSSPPDAKAENLVFDTVKEATTPPTITQPDNST